MSYENTNDLCLCKKIIKSIVVRKKERWERFTKLFPFGFVKVVKASGYMVVEKVYTKIQYKRKLPSKNCFIYIYDFSIATPAFPCKHKLKGAGGRSI